MTATDASAYFQPGTTIAQGRYRIEGLLGEGGMGTVYAATELALERKVALKVLLPELSQHPTARQRMEAEAKALARIRSQHVVGVNTVFDEQGLLVIDLEFMSGGALADRLKGEGVDEATSRDWIGQVLQGLEALHGAGFVHRDLKPANVLIDDRGVLKVTDLGIAHDSQRTSGFKTRHDSHLGTAEYMAPEQVQSATTVDARADVYAAGVMLYELLVGRVPFVGSEFDVKVAQVHQAADLGPLRAKSSALAPVVERALAKDPGQRWQTAREMRLALAAAGAAVVSPAVVPVSSAPAGKGVGKWLAAAAGAVALVATVAAFVVEERPTDVVGGQDGGAPEAQRAQDASTAGDESRYPTLAAADRASSVGDDLAARAGYDTACQAGSHRGCVEFAYLQHKGRGGTQAKEAAHTLALSHIRAVEGQCARGSGADCVAAALALKSGMGVAKDELRVVELYRKACDGGNMRGCSSLGVRYNSGMGVAKDEARAVELFRKACDGGNMSGCSNLGDMYRNGTIVAKDEGRAVELYRKACDRGEMRACNNLGVSFAIGAVVAKDEARAVELYYKACAGANMDACNNLGWMYQNGTGVAKDEARAVELYRKACDGGNMDSCNNLGWMYQNGTGVAKDEARAVELYRKACDGGNMDSCGNLGVMYDNGTGVGKDEVRAVELYRKACDGGNMVSCGNLGVMYDQGTGVAKEEARAVELYRKACDGGKTGSCGNLGLMYYYGRGVAKDRTRAVELYRKACDGGDQNACILRAL